MKELKPDCFEDIVAGVSLYRPGPMDQIPRYITKEELTQDMIDSVEKILDETEYWYDDLMRDKIRNIKTETLKNQLSDSLTNYIDNCTDQEWNKLLNEYNVSDEENYMGEVRENLEESIMEYFEDEELEKQEEMLEFFKKYDVIEKEQEEELER